ncbi:MAG: thiamine phosphate synthase [Bryobacterales bacterium]|nr:thiamine phosphate synthase [Bryobacteraceae bacterium]MDW8129182.1 thiamine phosphate synthase [Bryobacterales bacterium]
MLRLPRLYPILDTATLARCGLEPEEAARAMLEAGARILQLRHKGPFTRRLLEAALQISALCRGRGASFIVNDRADIALLTDAGLHVGQDDLPPAYARRLLGAGRLLGFSTHNAEQLAAALGEPVDYVAFGPIFATGSKLDHDPVVGLAALPQLAAQAHAAGRPLVAIGGITRARALEVLAAGADSVAVIADLYPEPCDAESLRQRVREWLDLLPPTRD